MILITHMLMGAAIASKITNPILAVILAFFSHYLLDLIPHNEYPVENLKNGEWNNALPDFLRVILDFCLGILLISMLSGGELIIYICAFFAILPDGLTILNSIFSNEILEIHNNFHREKIHFLKNKKILGFWRILNQILAIVITLIVF